MNTSLVKFGELREDMSDYLFHFTKGEDACLTLEKILGERILRDINGNGYICFTEAPIHMLADFFKYICQQYKIPKIIAPYGIGIKKDLLFKKGARPVIYGTPDEKRLLSDELQWRHVDMNLPNYDFSWLREWRLKLKEGKIGIRFSPDQVVVVTRTQDEQMLFREIEIDNPDGYEELDESMIEFKQIYRGFSFDEIDKYNTKRKIEDLFLQQLEIIEEQ